MYMDSQRTPSKMSEFFKRYPRVTYKKGNILIHNEETPAGFFYLEHGTVKQYGISQKGEELVINVYRPKAFFPITWGLNNIPNRYDFEAIEDIECYVAPREDVLAFLQDHPDEVMHLLTRIVTGIDGILLRMEHLLSGNAYRRTIAEITIQARRFGKSDAQGGEVRLRLKESAIADQTGLSRETVSRQISLLKKKDLVQFERGILTIPILKNLEDELTSSSYE